MKPHRYFARQDHPSLNTLNEIFKHDDRYVYFIERETDHQWLTQDCEHTTDPLKAWQFKTRIDAQISINMRGYGNNHIVTEHEFTEPSQQP